jgi:two-component system LytT family sensor kinase
MPTVISKASARPRFLGPAIVVAIVATFAGVYFATQLRYAYAPTVTSTWPEALTVNLTFYYLWALAVPLIVAISRRFPLDEARWPRHVALHVAASVAVTLLLVVAGDLVLRLLGHRSSMTAAESALKSIRLNFHSSLPTYWLILFAYTAWEYHRRYRERELRASRLEARLADARLEALRTQLNPHFLFNALHSISSLMYTDVEAADRMMARLSELLRLTLDRSAQELPLREEMEILRRYLEIEKIRFEERLDVLVEVPEAVEGARVPAFSLQPIVENAVRHAIAPRAGGGRVAIRACRVDGMLRVSVCDDGPGLGDAPPRGGVGLANVRERLEQLYGARQSLVLKDAPGGGLAVELTVPYREDDGVRRADRR